MERGSNGDVRRGDDRVSVGRGRAPPGRVGPASPVSAGARTRLLIGLWIAAGLATGASALALGLSDAAPTSTVVVLAGLVGTLAVLPFLVLRSLRAGHLSARNDRARLRGLFGATLDVNRAMGIDETRMTVLASAETLLRAPEVTLTDERPARPGAGRADAGRRSHALARRGGAEPDGTVRRCRSRPVRGAGLGRRRGPGQCRALRGGAAATREPLEDHPQPRRGRVRRRRGRADHLHEPGRRPTCSAGTARDRRRRPGRPRDGGAGLPARARPAGHRAGAQRHERRHALPAPGRIALPRHHDRLAGDGGPASSGAVIVFRDTSERKAFEEQLARHAFQDALDRVGQPPPPARPPRSRAVAGEPDRRHGGGAVL